MKNIIITLIILLLLCNIFPVCNSASAETGTFILIPEIAQNDIYFYKDSISAPKMFKLPKTYYVKLEKAAEEDANYYFVSYNEIKGLLKKSEISNPYMADNINNPYFIEDAVLYPKKMIYLKEKNSPDSTNIKTLESSSALTYISYLKDGQGVIWYYVKSGTDYGYVLSDDLNKNNYDDIMDLSRHPNSVINENNGSSNENQNNTNINTPKNGDTNNNLLNFALAIGISIPTIVLIIMIFKPSSGNFKRNKKGNYRSNVKRNDNYDEGYDRRDYYDDRPPRR